MERQQGPSRTMEKHNVAKSHRTVNIIKTVLRKRFIENIRRSRAHCTDATRNLPDVFRNINIMEMEEIKNSNLTEDEVFQIIEEVQGEVYNEKLLTDFEEHDRNYNSYLFSLCEDNQCVVCNEGSITEHMCDSCAKDITQ